MNTNIEIQRETDFLFTRPSFISGFISITDWANSLNIYNESASPAEADMKAMKADWSSVAKDISFAMSEHDEIKP